MSTNPSQSTPLIAAAPFWVSLLLLPLIVFAVTVGSFWFILVPVTVWYVFTFLDMVTGLDLRNPDPNADDNQLHWHILITKIWFPLQFVTTFWAIWVVANGDYRLWEIVGIFFAVGSVNGTIGINYAHELMHQSSKLERWLADLLLANVLYSHFRSEHLLVHHIYVGTPRDAVTARYGQGFHSYFRRALVHCYRFAFKAEKARLARKGARWHDRSNPFWRYWALQSAMLFLAIILGGGAGFLMFIGQAFIAIAHLELVNYIEHYGLTRRHLGDGKYEHVKPHHSWNAAHMATNRLLINLQRHSDHHYKPNRRFPLLQNYTISEAPQLPYGYSVMALLALYPRAWKARMNPRVRKWREMYYPDITDWTEYNKGKTPLPR